MNNMNKTKKRLNTNWEDKKQQRGKQSDVEEMKKERKAILRRE